MTIKSVFVEQLLNMERPFDLSRFTFKRLLG